jgi:hypothetical protein
MVGKRMAEPGDRARTVLVGVAIIAVVASLAGFFAWRAGQGAPEGAAPATTAPARD